MKIAPFIQIQTKENVKGIFGKQECLCAFNDSKKEKIAKNNC